MRPAGDLRKVRDRLVWRALRLEAFASNVLPQEAQTRERAASYYSIELSNAWDGFARCFSLSVIVGARSPSGPEFAKLAVPCRSEQEALKEAFRVRNPHRPVPAKVKHRDEPDWYDVDVLLDLAGSLGFSNQPRVRLAAGFPKQPLDTLRTIRNYYAHKSESTAARMVTLGRQLGFGALARPSDLLFLKVPASHLENFRLLSRDLRTRATAIVA